jgi:CheY-like chemotaxis protein
MYGFCPRRMSQDAKKPLGRILLQQRAVTQAQLDVALEEARAAGVPLATRLTDAGTLSEVEALKALSEQSGVPGIDLNQVCIRLSDLAILPREIAVRHKLLPVLVRDDRIFVAMAAPTEKKVIDELEFVTGKRVFPYIALAGPLQRVIAQAYEMWDRNEAYYVGPSCPPEVLRKAGLSLSPPKPAEPAPAAPAAGVPRPPPLPRDAGVRAAAPAQPAAPATPPAPARPPGPPPHRPVAPPSAAVPPRAAPGAKTGNMETSVVLDDAMNRMAVADELTDADFGLTGRDISVVTDLPKEQAPAPKAGQRTVLIVDDEDEIRKLLRRVLEARGFRVREADRGNTALKLVKEEPPDVMILDAMLPEVHGFDIARRIKGSERYGKIPIIMVSAVYRGWRFAEDLKTSYGVDAFIEKPFKIGDVVSAVEKALEQKKEPAEAPEKISAEARAPPRRGHRGVQGGRLRQGRAAPPRGHEDRPARVPAALPPRPALRQAGPDLRGDPGAGDRARHQQPALPRPQEPRGALPEGGFSQQSDRDLGARAPRRAGRRHPADHQGTSAWLAVAFCDGAAADHGRARARAAPAAPRAGGAQNVLVSNRKG